MVQKTTTAVPFEIAQVAHTTDGVWLVDNQRDADAITAKYSGGFIISVGDLPISEWTASAGTPLEAMAQEMDLSKKKFYIAFQPFTLTQKKTQNFITRLKIELGALGAGVHTITSEDYNLLHDAKSFVGLDTAKSNAEKKTEQSKLSDADVMFGIAKEKFWFNRTQSGEYYLVPRSSTPRIAWMADAEKLRLFLIRECRAITDSVPAPSAWLAAIDAIKAECAIAPVKELKIRSGVTHGNVWMDLGRDDGYMICLNNERWTLRGSIAENATFAFQRTTSVLPLPQPAQVSLADTKLTLQKLLKPYVNVSDEDWPLLVGYMVTHLLPGYKMPIMLLTSEAQSGKSTATMAVRYAVEGNSGRGEKLPSKEDDIAVTMSKESMTLYNNVSHIGPELSDFLCQVVDGATYAKRKLRTDSDTVQLTLDASLLMNGITTGKLRSDFKTRSVRLGLVPMTGAPMRDEHIDQALREAHPQILGSLLTLAVHALAHIPTQDEAPAGFRMIDYVQVVRSIEAAWNMDGISIARYKESLDEMSAEALESPLFQTIHRMAVTHENRQADGSYVAHLGVKAIISEHNRNLMATMFNEAMGKKTVSISTGQQLGAELNRSITDWKRHGITMVNQKQKSLNGIRDTYYSFYFVPTEVVAWDILPHHYISL